jgi:transcription antitermination protein NusB
MLNRRILRIKVMQALYALKQGEVANYHNALVQIDEVFAPDLSSMEKPDLKKLQQNKKRASILFEELFKKGSSALEEKEQPEIAEAARQAIKQYHNQVKKDKKHFGSLMIKDVEGIYSNYLLVLALLTELADYSLVDEEERKIKQIATKASGELKLKNNRIIVLLNNNKELNQNSKKGTRVWDNEIVRKIYRLLKADKEFIEYAGLKENDFEADKKIILHISKNIIFKDVFLQGFFEEKDLSWSENRSIVKSMVGKTIKSVEEKDKEITLLSISANWEEDKVFFEELYSKTVENDSELEKITSPKIENWDIERVAATDRIILMMAVSEMINFSSIPVKVTINEYIELSKLYSTPKSKQFINGILDKLAEDLTKKGMIKKSGRGLIDNK